MMISSQTPTVFLISDFRSLAKLDENASQGYPSAAASLHRWDKTARYSPANYRRDRHPKPNHAESQAAGYPLYGCSSKGPIDLPWYCQTWTLPLRATPRQNQLRINVHN